MGKEWAGLFFPRGKNGPAHSFPGEKTDWGEIPACYTGIPNKSLVLDTVRCIFVTVTLTLYVFAECSSKELQLI